MNRYPSTLFLLFHALILIQTLSGCSYFRSTNVSNPNDGLTLVLPGIEGASFINSNIASGLVEGEVPGRVEIFEWTSGDALRSLQHLSDIARVEWQSNRLASLIMRYQKDNHFAPLNLVAHSGGAGVIVKALEKLPDEHSVNCVVLIAPAVSRSYPIDQICSKSVNGIWNFHSPFDAQLMVGTRIAGTIDRKYEIAAGGLGFDLDSPGLTQIPFSPEMFWDGNHGGHLGGTSRKFVKNQIAPIIKQTHFPQLR